MWRISWIKNSCISAAKEKIFLSTKILGWSRKIKLMLRLTQKITLQGGLITCQSQIKKISQFLFLGFFSFFIIACTTAGNAIPQGGPTMAQVYKQAMQKSSGSTLDVVRRKVQSQNISDFQNLNNENYLSAYTRTSQNVINNLFPQIPNPELVMFVYPHLAEQNELPVPGYSTAFLLFKKTFYA
jgi:conjugative transfer region lipoprotein (TIGR03751 family)